MQEYNSTLGLANRYWLDDIANSITLRCDIHWEFDMGAFVVDAYVCNKMAIFNKARRPDKKNR
jgi:HNH endonuclease